MDWPVAHGNEGELFFVHSIRAVQTVITGSGFQTSYADTRFVVKAKTKVIAEHMVAEREEKQTTRDWPAPVKIFAVALGSDLYCQDVVMLNDSELELLYQRTGQR